mgnify:CR=1 FL=1
MPAKDNDWKSRLGIVYSTNPDFAFDSSEEEEADTPPKNRQKLRVGIERKNRGGKVVTVVKGFVGAEADLKELGRMLKTKCGVGGASIGRIPCLLPAQATHSMYFRQVFRKQGEQTNCRLQHHANVSH